MALIEVIKYEGNSDLLVWKFPSTELGTGTQLIVNEAQEAILFKDGKVFDVFTAGRHTLSTQNIPLLNKIINLPFGGQSPFKAEVWYINKLHTLDVKWGTTTPIQLQDPKYGIFIPVRAFGQFGIQVSDTKTFLTKLVGTLPKFEKDDFVNYFRGIFITKAKDLISTYITQKQVSILEINSYLEEISDYLKETMTPILKEYGITLINFLVNSINIPEDDPATIKLKEALSRRAEMDIVGYSYEQERSFDTLEGAAKNQGSMASGFMGSGMGLGMGLGLGRTMSNQFSDISSNITTKKLVNCNKCNAMIDADKKFCPECGEPNTKPTKENKSEEKHCWNCNSKIDEKAKFCPECGKETARKCPKCNNDVTPDSKFCVQCGEKL